MMYGIFYVHGHQVKAAALLLVEIFQRNCQSTSILCAVLSISRWFCVPIEKLCHQNWLLWHKIANITICCWFVVRRFLYAFRDNHAHTHRHVHPILFTASELSKLSTRWPHKNKMIHLSAHFMWQKKKTAIEFTTNTLLIRWHMRYLCCVEHMGPCAAAATTAGVTMVNRSVRAHVFTKNIWLQFKWW